MINVKVYEYDSSQESNGYRGTDYSSHVTQGFQDTEDITQEMDTSEITLAGLDFNTEFDPERKFIIDVVNTDELGNEEIVETLHRVVARDFVQQPILSDDSYFDHHISFIEPSVIAQKRLVDNISVTYKLKDVSLEEATAYPQTEITYGIQDSTFVPDRNITINKTPGLITSYNADCAKYFELEGALQITNTQGDVTNIYNNIEDFNNGSAYVCNITLPKMAIYFGNRNAKTFSKIGYASIDYIIYEYPLNREDSPTIIASDSFISNSDLGNGDSLDLDYRIEKWRNKINGEWLLEKVGIEEWFLHRAPQYYFKKYTNKSASTPTYQINNIPIQADKRYVIQVSLHQFEDNIPTTILPNNESENRYKIYDDANPRYYSSLSASYDTVFGLYYQSIKRRINLSLQTNQTAYSFNFITYSRDSKTIVYASSTPYSALALLQKAIINSGDYEKKANVYIADVNNSDLPYVIDTDYVDKLAATRIIENFYNQKNLWEIMVEVGHYIHSIPELKFGADDKFLITFNELGRTDQKPDYGTKVSIFNSRSVEDYICATSSYVSNMVQLGGYIEEWVAPKTSDETLIVSNDTASIITTKPIIELLNVTVRANKNLTFSGGSITAGQTADMTPFIYEENVYKVLSLDYDANPNRGIAMYYTLGENEIKGGQYQLPQSNDNIYSDYAFKKIIYSAYFGYEVYSQTETSTKWYNLSVNDFTFFVRYRTKDSVRQDHVRPDLRKYLLNSKHDKIPQHNQFNNQQDILVDSIKFGNNVYGKLIKTGNSEYTKTEWVTEYSALKHKGELYSIHGQLYYVANVTNTYYSSYILSEVKFSKDYNELSAVIGIPSEPRFYEISEQSSIKREKNLNSVVLLTFNDYIWADIIPPNPTVNNLGYNSYIEDLRHITDLIFGGETGTFAKYALTTYKGDKDTDKYDQTVGQPKFYKEVLTPINAYSSENTLTYEWDMIDNYSAGDKVIKCDTPSSVSNDSYKSLQAVGYTDIYGKAPLMDFYLLKNIPDLSLIETQSLPQSPLQTRGFYIGEEDASGITLPGDADLGDTYYLLAYSYRFTSVDDYVGYYILRSSSYELVTNDNKNDLGILPGTTSAYDTFNNFVYQTTGRSPEIGDMIKFNWFGFFGNLLNTYLYALVKDNNQSNSTKWERQKIDDTFVIPTQKFLGTYSDNILATNKHNYGSNYNGEGIGLLKDCREIMSFNYNVQLVTDSDQFVLSPFLFLPNKNDVKIVLLNTEVNKLSDGYIDVASILTPKDINGNDMDPYFQVPTKISYSHRSGWDSDISLITTSRFNINSRFEQVNENHFNGTEGYEQVKAIAFICNVNINPDLANDESARIPYKQQFIIARNIPDNIGKTNAVSNWTIGSPSKNLYRNKQ